MEINCIRDAVAPRHYARAGTFIYGVYQNESRICTPVVRLRDGSYVPKYPSHLHIRGRLHAWTRETLEGSLFLLIDVQIRPIPWKGNKSNYSYLQGLL
jgi:hypothetical protein